MAITPGEVIAHEVEGALASILGPPRTARRRVVYFMRSIDCRVCRRHVARLAELAPALAALDAEVNVIAPGAPSREQPAWTGTLPFPVTCSSELFAAAGFDRLLAILQRSGTVVLDADQTVLLARRTALPFKSFCEAELVASLRVERSFGPCSAQVA